MSLVFLIASWKLPSVHLVFSKVAFTMLHSATVRKKVTSEVRNSYIVKQSDSTSALERTEIECRMF